MTTARQRMTVGLLLFVGLMLPSRVFAGELPAGAIRGDLRFLAQRDGDVWVKGDTFPFNEVRDLHIVTRWQNFFGSHTQRLRLYAPDGHLYEEWEAPLVGHAPKKSRGKPQARVITRLPVGGSWITRHALIGEWRVEVFLDAEPTPRLSRSFHLSP